MQLFASGTLYQAGSGTAYPLSGSALAAYVATKAQKGAYGWPTSGVIATTAHGGGTYLTTQKGAIYLAKGALALGVLNPGVATEYASLGGVAGIPRLALFGIAPDLGFDARHDPVVSRRQGVLERHLGIPLGRRPVPCRVPAGR